MREIHKSAKPRVASFPRIVVAVGTCFRILNPELEKIRFIGADTSSLLEINKHLRHMVITPREYLVRAGEVVHSMYFVISGNLRVLDGEGNIVATIHEGGVIGEVGIILNTTAVCDVQTTSTCELFRLTREDYETILKVCTLNLGLITHPPRKFWHSRTFLDPLDSTGQELNPPPPRARDHPKLGISCV